MLIRENVVPFQDEIVAISQKATGEWKLERDFKDVESGLNELSFTLVPYGDKY